MKSYLVKSSANRAAKKEFGDDWALAVDVFQNPDQSWSYDVKSSNQSTAELLDEIEAQNKASAAKVKEIKARKPVHVPAPVEPAPEPEIAPEQAQADRQADAQLVNINPLKPRISTVEKPTKLVWSIADYMPGASRKEVVEACVARGIAYGTSRTQYQHWFKTQADSAKTPRASIKDGKIIPPQAA